MGEKHYILEDDQVDAIEASCRRHNLSEGEIEKVIEWAGLVQIQNGLIQGITTGHTDVVGLRETGEPEFRLTQKGTDHVEINLLKLRPKKGVSNGA